MLKNLHTHFQGDTIEKLTSLVERVSTEVSTERAAFTTSSAAHGEQRDSATETFSSLETKPQIQFAPRVLSPEELVQAEEAFHFDLRSDFDETEFEEEEI